MRRSLFDSSRGSLNDETTPEPVAAAAAAAVVVLKQAKTNLQWEKLSQTLRLYGLKMTKGAWWNALTITF